VRFSIQPSVKFVGEIKELTIGVEHRSVRFMLF
jgi:hypothetical protein